MKALIISVGTGTKPTKEAIESLANAIVFSIKNHNPDKTFFVVSQESLDATLPKIIEKTQTKNYESIKIQNPDDIQQIYENLKQKLKQIKKNYDQVTIDYTSGTKAMTSALAVLGTIYEVNTLSYITGERMGGVVQAGTEKLNLVQPYFAIAEQKTKNAIQFFNKNQFNATITIINQIEKTTTDPQIIDPTNPLKNLAKAYKAWDIFNHQKAFSTLKRIEIEETDKNKRFLGQLFHTPEPDPYYIADLINNAKRRGTDEEKYDDATARLYRTIELIAQYQLKTKHNIRTSTLRPDDIPEELKKKWNLPPITAQIKIGLEKAYELLEAKNDPIGIRFAQDNKLKNVLSKRNTSILAHNLKPIDKQTYTELHKKTLEYAKLTMKSLNQLLEDSTFIKWKE